MAVLRFYTQTGLPALRRALPDAEWTVQLAGEDLVWEEGTGEYAFR
jgi:hypothetical protein